MKAAKFSPVKSIKALARADMAFYLLPLIMLNLAAGTLAERYLGLYQAQKTFFSSFILRAGPLPLPGGYLLTGALGLCLALKFIFESQWKYKKSGLNLAHLGALILLFGGLVASYTSREGFMLIAEGEASPYVYDYQNRDLFIFENDDLAYTLPFAVLGRAAMPLPFTLKVAGTCGNCAIIKRENAAEKTPDPKGMARFMALEPKPLDKEPERDLSGVTMQISGLDAAQDGLYIAFEGMPKPVELSKNGINYKLMFGKEQRALPFSVKLEKFTRENYPGETMAKNYSSDVKIIDGGAQWPARIEMNKPLRYKGYTLYQSSFEQNPDKTASILSVVENKGRTFPYLGTAILAFGLLLHLFIKARERKAK